MCGAPGEADGDRGEPRPDRRARLEPLHRPERRDERVLDDVLRDLAAVGQPIGEVEQALPMLPEPRVPEHGRYLLSLLPQVLRLGP